MTAQWRASGDSSSMAPAGHVCVHGVQRARQPGGYECWRANAQLAVCRRQALQPDTDGHPESIVHTMVAVCLRRCCALSHTCSAHSPQHAMSQSRSATCPQHAMRRRMLPPPPLEHHPPAAPPSCSTPATLRAALRSTSQNPGCWSRSSAPAVPAVPRRASSNTIRSCSTISLAGNIAVCLSHFAISPGMGGEGATIATECPRAQVVSALIQVAEFNGARNCIRRHTLTQNHMPVGDCAQGMGRCEAGDQLHS